MKAELYLDGVDKPVSILDEVRVVEMANENHPQHRRLRVYYRTRHLNAGKTFVELHRDRKLTLRLDDGRTAQVLLAHNSLDMEGNFVGVLRVLGELS